MLELLKLGWGRFAVAFVADAASILPPTAGSASAQGLKPPMHRAAAGGSVHWVHAKIPQEKK